MTSAEIVDCKSLARGSLIDVETKSRHYRIECLGGNAIPHFRPPGVLPRSSALRDCKAP